MSNHLSSRSSVVLALGLLVLGLAACGQAEPTPVPQPTPKSQATVEATVRDDLATAIPTPPQLLPESVLLFPLCEPYFGEDELRFAEQIRQMELGFRTIDSGLVTSMPTESLMIAGDLNMVDVSLVVQHHMNDLDAFASNVADPEGCPDERTLRDAAQAAISQVVGQRTIDDALTAKRAEVQTDTHALLQKILDSYGAGIDITAVLLQEVKPPEQVLDAYQDVDRARQDKETTINQAEAYQSDILPRARGEAERLLQSAEALKQERIAKAEGEAARFVSILREYAKEEGEAFKGLYLESLESILPGISEFIVAAKVAASSSKSVFLYDHLLSSSSLISGPFQRAVLTQYDGAGGVITGRGLTAGLASPNSGSPFDSRLLYLDLPPMTLPDRDKQFLVVDVYTRYRITDEEKFSEKIGTFQRAEDRIGRIVASNLREEIAGRTREEIIGARVEKTTEGEVVYIATNTRQEILDNVLAAANGMTGPRGENFGVAIIDVRMKRVSFPEAAQEAIFNRMRAERARISTQFRADGAEQYARIRAAADRERAIILAEAQRRAEVIAGEGEARAIDIIIEALAEVPELSGYRKSLEAYKIARGLASN